MDLEILVTPDCPHRGPVEVLLRATLAELGMVGAPFVTTVVSTPAEARQHGFIGSPTILVDGQDPFTVPGAPPALACRLYVGPDGTSGLPAQDELRRALEHAASGGEPPTEGVGPSPGPLGPVHPLPRWIR